MATFKDKKENIVSIWNKRTTNFGKRKKITAHSAQKGEENDRYKFDKNKQRIGKRKY